MRKKTVMRLVNTLNNLEFTQVILEASQEENAPVILGVSEGAARYMSGFIQL